MNFEPVNEAGVIALFWTQALAVGWEPVELGTAFPDAILRKDGGTWKVEFEFLARNFIGHGHDLRECDLIICWENNWKSCPLPVLALREKDWATTRLFRADVKDIQIEYWKNRARIAERKNSASRTEIPVAKVVPDITEVDDEQAAVLYNMWKGGTSKNELIRQVFGKEKNRSRFDTIIEALERGERLALAETS